MSEENKKLIDLEGLKHYNDKLKEKFYEKGENISIRQEDGYNAISIADGYYPDGTAKSFAEMSGSGQLYLQHDSDPHIELTTDIRTEREMGAKQTIIRPDKIEMLKISDAETYFNTFHFPPIDKESETGEFTLATEKYVDDKFTKEDGTIADILKKIVGNALFPEGFVYISMSPTSPKTLYGGEWEELASERTLWITSTTNENKIAGDIEEAGLPDPQTVFNVRSGKVSMTTDYGNQGDRIVTQAEATNVEAIPSQFNVRATNEIYGNSDTVQPPAIRVYAWKRTALAE